MGIASRSLEMVIECLASARWVMPYQQLEINPSAACTLAVRAAAVAMPSVIDQLGHVVGVSVGPARSLGSGPGPSRPKEAWQRKS